MKKVKWLLFISLLIAVACVACGCAHKHSFDEGVLTKAPTCEQEGVKTFTCSCGETETQTVEALGGEHQYGQLIEKESSNILSHGYLSHYKCAVCGEYFDENKQPVTFEELKIKHWNDESYEAWTISNEIEFMEFGDLVTDMGLDLEGKTIVLDADLELSGYDWTPIGLGTRVDKSYIGKSFKGTFDGQGHTIGGITIAGNDYDANASIGLFGVLDGGEIKNLNITVSINVPQSEMVGGLVGCIVNDGRVSGVTVSGNISAKCEVGGIAGLILVCGEISDCTNNAAINAVGTGNAGGIAGGAYYSEENKTSYIKNCVNNGNVTNGTVNTGGIVGFSCAEVTDCTNNGRVTGDGSSEKHVGGVGGIVGHQVNCGKIVGCTNTAEIAGISEIKHQIAGIVEKETGDHINYGKHETIVIEDNREQGSVE